MSIFLLGKTLMTLGGAVIVGLGATFMFKPDILGAKYSWYQTVYGVVTPQSVAEDAIKDGYNTCNFKGQDKLKNQFACEVNKITVEPTDSTAAKTQVYSINASRDQLNGWKTKNIIVVKNDDGSKTTEIELFFDAPAGTTKQFLVKDVSEEVSENISKYECSWTGIDNSWKECKIKIFELDDGGKKFQFKNEEQTAHLSTDIYIIEQTSTFDSQATTIVKTTTNNKDQQYLIEFNNDKYAEYIDGFKKPAIHVKATTTTTKTITFKTISPYVYKNSQVGFQFSNKQLTNK